MRADPTLCFLSRVGLSKTISGADSLDADLRWAVSEVFDVGQLGKSGRVGYFTNP